MAGAYEEKLSYLPEDLAKKTQQAVKSLYFDVSVPNLLLDTNYAFEFQWLYEDGSKSSWSPGYRLKTAKIKGLFKYFTRKIRKKPVKIYARR